MSNNGCGQLGALQTRGTCWFYSILNGFILSEAGQKLLFMKLQKFYNELNANGKAYFDDGINAPCPASANLKKVREIYFWKFIDQYLCFMSGPRAGSLKASKSVELLKNINIQGELAKKNKGGKGAYPQIEIDGVLKHIGFKGEYVHDYVAGFPEPNAPASPQFVVVTQSQNLTHLYMNEIPKKYMNDSKFELMCASLVIANTTTYSSEMHRSHGLAGFVCNGRGYIFDSNQRQMFKCDWWNLADFKRVANKEVAQNYPFFRSGGINLHQYALVVFARKKFIEDVAPACLMKYTVKTPNGPFNYTNANLGPEINRGWYSHLGPAKLIAVKRKWARTEPKGSVYINKATYNSIINSAKNKNNAIHQFGALRAAGYKFRAESYNEFLRNLNAKFPAKVYTFAEAKAYMNKAQGITARKRAYSIVWRGVPMEQRAVLIHYRNTGEWPTNNAKPRPKTPSPPKSRPKTPNSNANRQGPAKYTLNNAKRNVNALTTAKARNNFYRRGTVGKGLTPTNLSELLVYIRAKNQEARNARSAKKSAKS